MTPPAGPSPLRMDFPPWFTPASLGGIVVGLALGIAGATAGWTPVFALADLLEPVGRIWLGALQLTVVPLVATQIALVVLGRSREDRLGRLTVRSLAFFAVAMVGSGVLTALGAPLLLALYDPPAAAATAGAGFDLLAPPAGDEGGSFSPGRYLLDVLTGEHLLPVLVIAAGAAALLRAAPAPILARARRGTAGAAAAVLRVVRWVLLASPVGVLALTLALALELGVDAAGVALAFIALSSLWLVLLTLVLYPLTVVTSGCPPGLFARALVPGQLVGLGTRSSLAALPALVEEAEHTLRLPSEGRGLVLPLAATLYKVGRPAQTTFELLFLVHVFGAAVGPFDVAVFIGTVLLLNLGAVGLPWGGPGGMRSFPAFVDAGVPMGPYFFIQALGTIPDFFETVVNVTAYLGAAVTLTWRPPEASLAGAGGTGRGTTAPGPERRPRAPRRTSP